MHPPVLRRFPVAAALIAAAGGAAAQEAQSAVLADSAVGYAALGAVFAYYLIAWLWAGNKQFRREVPLRPTAPETVSPAALRYVDRMGYDDQQLAVALLGMAVRGYLHFEDKDRTLSVVRDEAPESVLAPEERELAHRLFDGRTKLALSWSNRRTLVDLHRHFRHVLENRYRGKLFNTHALLRAVGVAVSLAALAALLADHGSAALQGLAELALGALCIAVAGLLGWHEYRRTHGAAAHVSIVTALAAAGVALAGLGFLADAVRTLLTGGFGGGLAALAALAGANALFLPRLPNYSREGWRLMLEAEGFRRFVKDGYNPEHEDLSTARLFELNLPQAAALGVGEEWAALFEGALVKAPRAERTGLDYMPIWYAGLKWERQTPGDFAVSFLRALAAAVSSMSGPAGHEPEIPRTRPNREEPPKRSPSGSRSDD